MDPLILIVSSGLAGVLVTLLGQTWNAARQHRREHLLRLDQTQEDDRAESRSGGLSKARGELLWTRMQQREEGFASARARLSLLGSTEVLGAWLAFSRTRRESEDRDSYEVAIAKAKFTVAMQQDLKVRPNLAIPKANA